MKFGQRFSKNTFKSFLAALILTAGVVGAASTALAAGEPVPQSQAVRYFLLVMIMRLTLNFLPDRVFFFRWLMIL